MSIPAWRALESEVSGGFGLEIAGFKAVLGSSDINREFAL